MSIQKDLSCATMFLLRSNKFIRSKSRTSAGWASAIPMNNTLQSGRRLTMDMIRVAANSRTAAVAGAIAGIVREHHRAEMQAIGAAAVNQAMKALILATGYLKDDGISVACVPEFAEVTIDDQVRTAIKFVIEPKPKEL
jgi:stage V sporulation protein S